MDSLPTIQKQYPREDCSSLHSDLALRQHRAWPNAQRISQGCEPSWTVAEMYLSTWKVMVFGNRRRIFVQYRFPILHRTICYMGKVQEAGLFWPALFFQIRKVHDEDVLDEQGESRRVPIEYMIKEN